MRVAIVAFFLLGLAARGAGFSAGLENDTVYPGEQARLTLTFQDGSPSAAPSLPAIPGLQISYLGESRQFSFNNGRSASSVTHSYGVSAQNPGEFLIPALTAEIDGKKLSSQPLKLKVIRPDPQQGDEQAAQQLAFARLKVPKKEVFVGEAMEVEFEVYQREGIANIEGNYNWLQQNAAALIKAEGFTVIKGFAKRLQRVPVGGVNFILGTIEFSISPAKTGELKVETMPFNLSEQIPVGGGGFFQQMDTRQVNFPVLTQTLQSWPLPKEGAPANFNGAVGRYELTVSVGPTNVASGDPITVRAQVSGHGALDALTLPAQEAWRDFKAYPPSASVQSDDPLGLEGSKVFEQIISPQSSDIRELPPLTFSFFDPEARRYVTLTHPATPLTIRASASSPAPVVTSASQKNPEPAPPRKDILPIRQRLGEFTKAPVPLVRQRWFLVVNCVPLLAFVGVAAWRRRADSLANNPRRRRQREVGRVMRAGVEELKRFAAANKSDDFFATLFRLLQEQMGERLDCPAISITEAAIDEKLRPRGLSEAGLFELHQLFQSCNAARYAPVQSKHELDALLPKFERVVTELKGVKP